MQVPPMYSALKKDGVRLYDLARKGIEVEREARKITIYDISDIEISLPYVSMNVSWSKGTYIRSLCYDIGEKLSAGATMVELKRTKTSVFLEKDSINIDDLDENNICEKLISIEDALAYYEKLHINNKYKKLFLNGVNVGDKRALKDKAEKGKLYRVYDEEDSFIGLGKLDGNGFKIEKLLI